MWTREQEQAITKKGSNLLVSAAAGSGKTAVLVERIIRLILDENDPVDVDNLLVLTFTNAAALEMRERIRKALENKLKEEFSPRINWQLALISQAKIMTIHAFCLDIIRQYFYLLDLDPGFRVADETEVDLLSLEVLDDLLERFYAQNKEEAAYLSDVFGGERNDEPLLRLILRIYNFMKINPDPKKWLEEKIAWFNLPFENDFDLDELIWIKEIKKEVCFELNKAKDYLEMAYLLNKKPGGADKYEKHLDEELIFLKDLASLNQEKPFRKFQNAFKEISFKNLPRVKSTEVDEKIKIQVQEFRNSAKNIIKGLNEKYFLDEPQVHLEVFSKMAPFMKALGNLVEDFSSLYQQEKNLKGIVDFSDLEHYCLEILQKKEDGKIFPSEIALTLQSKFSQVLVDEYQDINPLQEAILNLVAKDCSNLFMVGDIKQSIYRFRLAEPKLFLEKYRTYPRLEDIGDNCKADIGCCVELSKNFRSRREILEAVNFIFQRIMSYEVGEMFYTKKVSLAYGAVYPESFVQKEDVELHLLNQKELKILSEDNDEGEENAEDLDKIRAEVILVANRIEELFKEDFKVYDLKLAKYRRLNCRDIVILLRTVKDWSLIFLEELSLRGIYAYADSVSGYYDTVEVETVLSLLKLIDNKRQDIPLAGVLRSFIGGLTAQDLAEIGISGEGYDFYDKIKFYLENGENLSLKKSLAKFRASLTGWRELAREGKVSSLIWDIYQKTGYYDYIGALPNGVQRQANLRLFKERAEQYEKNDFRGLFGFLRFIERLRENKDNTTLARTLTENENVVRIMSIHKSKGLEFPIVFLAGLGKKFNLKDLNQSVLLHQDLGIGCDYIDEKLRIKYPTLAKLAIKNRLRSETLAEEMRILYVAMTRAKEKLILVGSARNLDKKIDSWIYGNNGKMLLSFTKTATAESFLDWIGMALAGHPDGALIFTKGQEPSVGLVIDEDNSSRWLIKIHEGINLRAFSLNNLKDQGWLEELTKISPLPEIERRLSFKPFQGLARIPAKLSVSELKKRKLEVEEDFLSYFEDKKENEEEKIYDFPWLYSSMEKTKAKPSSSEFGIIVHTVLQHLEIAPNLKKEDLILQVQKMQSQEILTPLEAKEVKYSLILNFLKSDLGQRLAKSKAIYREIPFSFNLPVKEIYEELDGMEQESILIQGAIDCLFREDDGLILLDYKTGKKQNQEMDFAQMKLYIRAIENITKEKIKEAYVYYLRLGLSRKVN